MALKPAQLGALAVTVSSLAQQSLPAWGSGIDRPSDVPIPLEVELTPEERELIRDVIQQYRLEIAGDHARLQDVIKEVMGRRATTRSVAEASEKTVSDAIRVERVATEVHAVTENQLRESRALTENATILAGRQGELERQIGRVGEDLAAVRTAVADGREGVHKLDYLVNAQVLLQAEKRVRQSLSKLDYLTQEEKEWYLDYWHGENALRQVILLSDDPVARQEFSAALLMASSNIATVFSRPEHDESGKLKNTELSRFGQFARAAWIGTAPDSRDKLVQPVYSPLAAVEFRPPNPDGKSADDVVSELIDALLKSPKTEVPETFRTALKGNLVGLLIEKMATQDLSGTRAAVEKLSEGPATKEMKANAWRFNEELRKEAAERRARESGGGKSTGDGPRESAFANRQRAVEQSEPPGGAGAGKDSPWPRGTPTLSIEIGPAEDQGGDGSSSDPGSSDDRGDGGDKGVAKESSTRGGGDREPGSSGRSNRP